MFSSLPGLCPSLWSGWRCQTTKRKVCLESPSSSTSSDVGFHSLCVYNRPSATSEHTVWTRLQTTFTSLATKHFVVVEAKLQIFFIHHILFILFIIAHLLFIQVGLFRKSGVKSRIQALRQQCESSPDLVNYDDQSAYDIADMVKQFFRDLPEPLLTSKLGDTFLHIYQCKSSHWTRQTLFQISIFWDKLDAFTVYSSSDVPKEQRMQAVRAAILLMPDENREVLQMLLYFLRDVTSLVEENQMTPMNLAVCLGPSLFHLSILKNETLSPRWEYANEENSQTFFQQECNLETKSVSLSIPKGQSRRSMLRVVPIRKIWVTTWLPLRGSRTWSQSASVSSRSGLTWVLLFLFKNVFQHVALKVLPDTWYFGKFSATVFH